MNSFSFPFEELPDFRDGEYRSGAHNGCAEISYSQNGEWVVRAIALDCHVSGKWLESLLSRTLPALSLSPDSPTCEPSMLRWFQALMPKEERFFDLFVRHATIVVAGSEALHGLLKGGDTIEHYCQIIFEREAEADEITRQVLTAVRRTFITPFDRTDIQDLVNALDDSIDQMNKTAKTIILFEVKNFQPEMQEMGEIIVEAARLVLEAMPLLANIGSNADKLNALTEKIIRVEERADQVYDKGRKALYLASAKGDAQSAMNFIIQADLYDHLEKVVDRFEDVSNEINALVTDHL